MVLTIETLFNDASIVKAVIDRLTQTSLDSIYWKRYLDFEETKNRVFKSYIGAVTGVMMGSIIDRNSNKPIRERKSLGSGYGEIAYLGDKYQLDNDRLDMIRSLINKFNTAKTADQAAAMNEIIDYIRDDMRQVLLAPHKMMDYVVGQLRSTGKVSITNAKNPQGIELIEINLPYKFLTPAIDDKTGFISYLQTEVTKLKPTHGTFSIMEMSRATFNSYILGSAEFQSTYKMLLSKAEVAVAGGLITNDMANTVLTGIGLPAIRIVEEYVVDKTGVSVPTFADKRITLLQQDKIGKMLWHEPYEASDPIPGKSYTRSEGGMYVSQARTEEGRFMEYGAEWIPNINPVRIVNVDLVNF